jgi:hypothetical protein
MIVNNRTSLLALCLAVPLLAACAGGSANSPGSSLPAGSPALGGWHPQDNRACQNDGGISVNPCFIKFTPSNSGPVTVVVRKDGRDGGGSGSRIRERDDCASENVATIVRDAKGKYTVTAGSMDGSCEAQFDSSGDRNNDGHQGPGGGSNLQIVNKT